jgi:Cell wall-associated hydrolases (invasion-associated proteins)
LTKPMTRRQAREAARKKNRELRPATKMLTMFAATGLLATFSLPSFGYNPAYTARTGLTNAEQADSQSQQLRVQAEAGVSFDRGSFSSTDDSVNQLTSTSNFRYTGPRYTDYLASPRFDQLTSANVMKAAAELVGTPYVLGGQTPAGIDCSGYVMFVYAQFGIEMPHSVYQQSRLPFAEKIPMEEAVPGDIVVFNDYSHNGIYAGNGNFYHAPQPGDKVKLAPIFTDRFHILGFGPINEENQ